MSLVAYTITAIERDVADATASGKQVRVGASCSMFIQPANTTVIMYDNAAGANGNAVKVTGANGQVVVYVEPGEYRVAVDGVDSYRVVSRDDSDIGDNTIYTSGNTNFNVFGGNAANDIIATGEATSVSNARFYLPVNGLTPPTDIDLVDTFNVFRGDSSVATGVIPTIGSISSDKILVINVSGLTLTLGEPLVLRTNLATSTITVNF